MPTATCAGRSAITPLENFKARYRIGADWRLSQLFGSCPLAVKRADNLVDHVTS